METACTFLFETLSQNDISAFKTLQTASKSRDDPFNLEDVLAFLPDRRHEQLAQVIRPLALPSLKYFAMEDPKRSTEHETAVALTSEIIWLLVRNRKKPPPAGLRLLIFDLHDALLSLPVRRSQITIVQICEWLWNIADPERCSILPQTLLFLLMRSFGDESFLVVGQPDSHGGSKSDVRRVFNIRKAYNEIDLAPNNPGATTVRGLLLRCATSATYFQMPEGRKFIAFLLTLDELRDEVFDTIIQQLAVVRKSAAPLFGNVFLHAWTTNRSDWLVARFINISEKAIRAAVDPFASNLRTVMSSFHFNKRMNGVDLLLYRIYSPTLFCNLLVANPFVRRNAVTIMADAFPIHDPGAMRQDIENNIEHQCSKFLELLTDPAPIVRCAAIEGVCRILGLFWELIPQLAGKKMIDLVISKLAFDSSSAAVRIAAFEGLRFLMENHLAHSLLIVGLPHLRPLVNDTVEKVRLGVLDLLLKIKEKRLQSMRYFDVVPVDDLLLRLPHEPPAVAVKIMRIVESSYFPQERPGKSADEIATLQIKACLSILQNCEHAARYFYRNINMYVAPGPLCEFVLRLSAIALDAPESASTRSRNGPTKGRRKKTPKRGRPRRVSFVDKNEAPPDSNVVHNDEEKDREDQVCREALLATVADVLVSIGPSLENERNAALRDYIENIFCGNVLKPTLVIRGNSIQSRTACWRIASCISVSKIKPITVLWREQMDGVIEWPHDNDTDAQNYRELLAAMTLCAFRWKVVPTLLAVVSGWCECAGQGHRTVRVGMKSARKGRPSTSSSRSRKKGAVTVYEDRAGTEEGLLATRLGSLFALQTFGNIIIDDDDSEVRCELERMLGAIPDDESEDGAASSPGRLVTCIRKGSIGAFDHVLETMEDGCSRSSLKEYPLLLQTLHVALKASLTFSIRRECQGGMLQDLREIMQWLGGEDLWKNLARVDPFFGYTLLSVCLGPIVDAAALRQFNKQDLDILEGISSQMVAKWEGRRVKSVSRSVSELLRLAFQLDEQSSFLDESNVRTPNAYNASDLRDFSRSILANALDLLKDSRAEEGKRTGDSFASTDLQSFFMRGLIHVSAAKDRPEFGQIFGHRLVRQFENEEGVRCSFIASTVCNGIRELFTLPSRGDSSLAMNVFSFVWNAMRNDSEAEASPHAAMVALVSSMLKCTQDFYEVEEKVPAIAARELLAMVESTVDNTFSRGAEPEGLVGGIGEVRELLGVLKNLQEVDVCMDNV